MVCVACSGLANRSLCWDCELSLRPGAEQYLAGVGTVQAAFRHGGAARQLVHHLKYRGVVAAGRVLAEAMACHLQGETFLVPVPRVGWRRIRYGIDPARELAGELARITGLPLLPVLRAPLWGRVRAGHAHGFAPRFRLHRSPGPVPVTLVDDVITTGSTLVAAARCLPGTTSAVTATTSARVGVGAKGPTPEGTSLPDAGLHME